MCQSDQNHHEGNASHATTSVTTNRILISLTACGALTLAACGSDSDSGDGGGGGDVEAFCDELAARADSDVDTTEEEDLAALRSIADSAPGEIADDMDTLVDAFAQAQAFDLESATEDRMAEFEGLIAEFEEATAAVEQYARDKCPDLPADFFSTE